MTEVSLALRVLFDATMAFGWLALIFWPLEWAFPAVPRQSRLRPAFLTDLAFFAGQQLCFGLLVLGALAHLRAASETLPLSSVRHAFATQTLWLQVIEVVMLGDLLVYWGHRLQHAWDPLWRFHRVHHTARTLDWLAAHREHPLDGLYTQVLMNLPMIVLGFGLREAAAVVVFRGVWAVFIHSNVRIPLGPLMWLFGAPQLHHWHHERRRDTVNYGNLAPWTDLLFATHACPEHEPQALGVPEPAAETYSGLLVEPFRPRRRDTETNANLCERRALQ